MHCLPLIFLLLRVVVAAQIRGYPCVGVSQNLTISRFSGLAVFIPSDELLVFRLEAAIISPEIVPDINSTTNRFTTLHVRIVDLAGNVTDEYLRLCDYITVLPLTANANGSISWPGEFAGFPGLGGPINSTGGHPGYPFEPNESHPYPSVPPSFMPQPPANISHVRAPNDTSCPLYFGDRFVLTYTFHARDYRSRGAYTATFSILSADAQPRKLACNTFAVTLPSATWVGIFPVTAVAALIVFTICTHAFIIQNSPFQESSNPFLFTVSSLCNGPLLDLLTPSYTDVIAYFQLVYFLAGLHLRYPGYFRPAMKKFAYILLSDIPFVGKTVPAVRDHVYVGYYETGLKAILVFSSGYGGIASYAWINFVIAFLIATVVAMAAGQAHLYMATRRHNARVRDPSARIHLSQNRKRNVLLLLGYFYIGLFQIFSLPLSVWTLYQILELIQVDAFFPQRHNSMVWSTALSILVAIVVFFHLVFLLYNIVRRRDRLYNSLTFMLLYGALYSRVRPTKLYFLAVTCGVGFLRAVVIATIANGFIQVILLAIFEIFHMCVLVAMGPYHLHTLLSWHVLFPLGCRFLVVLLCIAYVPELNLTEHARAIIGLFHFAIHGIVFIYFLIQNIRVIVLTVKARKNESLYEEANKTETSQMGSTGSTDSVDDVNRFYRGARVTPEVQNSFSPVVGTEPWSPEELEIFSMGMSGTSLPRANVSHVELFDQHFPGVYNLSVRDYTFRESDLRYKKAAFKVDPEVQQLWETRRHHRQERNPVSGRESTTYQREEYQRDRSYQGAELSREMDERDVHQQRVPESGRIMLVLASLGSFVKGFRPVQSAPIQSFQVSRPKPIVLRPVSYAKRHESADETLILPILPFKAHKEVGNPFDVTVEEEEATKRRLRDSQIEMDEFDFSY
ncbi:hypothetical protein BABINDRAFT_163686 [Babjeviella inositovora NRRL Y-12698]|uniref:TRP C-terminal domain-containing protein n=1 Tax=Babjeviella inositovora NRRL Y-12698 TaxID=984486 RepID=A0A1E3QIB1_9ASCO|nr:uncharacterized protein BABINDRAFT_163686 [Babjeviella inositovora NRRL Y-12698]ODQ77174.1 hypothetical protein BABINDRAFT_163686 [Babjeviella inositovora NRRL Y-12698]